MLRSILEVCGKTKAASLSFYYDYLAVVIWNDEDVSETLYVIHLKNEKVEKVTSFPKQVDVMSFIPCQENALIIGSDYDIYCFDIEHKSSKILKGHLYSPINISKRKGSKLLITMSMFEVILWSWPKCSLPKISKLKSNGHVIENKIVLALNFITYSSDGKWLIGTGSQALMVIYSMNCLRVGQVVQFSHIDSPLGIYDVIFLPEIHPQYPKCILVQTSRSIIIVDLVNFSPVKALNSNRYSIRKAQISGDGFLLGVIYGNGVLKIYTLLSFFPQLPNTLKLKEDTRKDHLFSASKWKEILNEFGEYPTRYRKHIWISLMKLPRNYSAINDILIKGKKHIFEDIKNIPIDIDSPTLESLRNVLELLCIWSPIVARLEFLPRFLLPFVKIFNRDILLCFEASMFIFLNWFRLLLNSWPSTTSIATEIVKQLLSENDSKLLIHLKKLKINIEDVAWSLMASGFREVLNEEDWLIAWDHILSKPNSYIIAFCAGLISQLKHIILRSSQKEVLLDLFHRETCIPIRLYLKKAETLHKNMLHEYQELKIDAKIILPKGSLPIFDIDSEDLKMTHKLASNFSNGHCKGRNSHGPVDDVFRMDHPDVTHSIHEKSSFINKGPVDTSHLRTKEDECLRNMQRVRKKIINQVII
ncbi:TBC1 domain family member 31 [Armadillidium nasatum]|uniref:TBC1 domain family member 31 n=1 Tax=Armadillidium nasatum TaxID=96803 RepID=A0A5N5SRA7_9CRUS|nr:TBC1 domain family member 31 [Armadillidium nasatum]